ncbi:unnamed protein product [Clavelina lepadiformis]|uniref:Protein arginine methyltransferase NDUFAF7 n=1 Tax=Clavelina lepadiformis TaxID=159417 RepID=A0ABP0GKN0_CLALP
MEFSTCTELQSRCFYRSDSKQSPASVAEFIYNKILTTGPISVSEFMKIALTFPKVGYYMNRDVFGKQGDFVTSPELSQMFGELIAAWFVSEWNNLGAPGSIQLVELGPGRGTLACDILRTFKQLRQVLQDTKMSFHFVEMSPFLSKVQYELLCCKPLEKKIVFCTDNYFLSGRTPENIDLFWHNALDTVPRGTFMLFIAHEFFDALPVHKFVKKDGIWKEMYIDICSDGTKKNLRFVLLPNPTLACKTLIARDEARQQVEVSPQSSLIVQEMTSRISESNGAALIGDYGHFGTKEDTLRGFKKHQLADVLSDLGECDITADVDFKYLRNAALQCNVDVSGPISQHNFLKHLGIDTRLMMLLRSSSDPEVRRKLIGGYDIMINPAQMGERFQFLSITSRSRLKDKNNKSVPITGFE